MADGRRVGFDRHGAQGRHGIASSRSGRTDVTFATANIFSDRFLRFLEPCSQVTASGTVATPLGKTLLNGSSIAMVSPRVDTHRPDSLFTPI
jgi:hypothetical protein